MNDRPESEDGEIERLRAEAADLRGRIDRLERDRAPAGDRFDCPDCSHRRPVPAVGPWFIHTDTGLVICWLSIAAMILHIVTMRCKRGLSPTSRSGLTDGICGRSG